MLISKRCTKFGNFSLDETKSIAMFSDKINHIRIQQVLVFAMGVLSFAVIMTSCTHASKSCSAYQEIEMAE